MRTVRSVRFLCERRYSTLCMTLNSPGTPIHVRLRSSRSMNSWKHPPPWCARDAPRASIFRSSLPGRRSPSSYEWGDPYLGRLGGGNRKHDLRRGLVDAAFRLDSPPSLLQIDTLDIHTLSSATSLSIATLPVCPGEVNEEEEESLSRHLGGGLRTCNRTAQSPGKRKIGTPLIDTFSTTFSTRLFSSATSKLKRRLDGNRAASRVGRAGQCPKINKRRGELKCGGQR